MPLMLFIIILGLLAGCASGPRYDEQIKQGYRPGMSRDEAHTLLAHSRLRSSATRPATGWSASSKDDAARAAFHFARFHPGTTVQTCEVYWVWRHTSVPMAVPGIWYDYLFFDSQDKLLDHH